LRLGSEWKSNLENITAAHNGNFNTMKVVNRSILKSSAWIIVIWIFPTALKNLFVLAKRVGYRTRNT